MIFPKKDLDKVKRYMGKKGYKFCRIIILDYGRTIKMVVSKNNLEYVIPLIEVFYDTDNKGEITKYHGTVDIRDSKVWKNKISKKKK